MTKINETGSRRQNSRTERDFGVCKGAGRKSFSCFVAKTSIKEDRKKVLKKEKKKIEKEISVLEREEEKLIKQKLLDLESDK